MDVISVGDAYRGYDYVSTNDRNKKTNERRADKETEPVDTKGQIDSDSSTCYDKGIFQPARREELLEKMLNSMGKVEGLEKITAYDESIGKEIYAFSIYDGKVHVSGNEGFENKAMTYERLVNASLNKSWNCLFKGAIVGEEKLLETVDGILKYYMNIDNEYKKSNKNDSITNHVEDAFQKWCDDHKQKEIHFDGRA